MIKHRPDSRYTALQSTNYNILQYKICKRKGGKFTAIGYGHHVVCPQNLGASPWCIYMKGKGKLEMCISEYLGEYCQRNQFKLYKNFVE